MKRLLFLCFVLAFAAMSGAKTSPPVLVLRGGTLVDVTAGKEIPDSVIVIRGERIEQISVGHTSIPDGAQIIDAQGKWIIPGLIDSHAHAQDADETPLGLYLANGVTTIRNPGGNITVLRLTRERLLRGELVGPRLFFAGPVLDGLPPVWPNISLLVDTPQRATSAVNFLADQGVDFVKVYNNVKEPELKAIVETVEETRVARGRTHTTVNDHDARSRARHNEAGTHSGYRERNAQCRRGRAHRSFAAWKARADAVAAIRSPVAEDACIGPTARTVQSVS
jgi:hypothetical protein